MIIGHGQQLHLNSILALELFLVIIVEQYTFLLNNAIQLYYKLSS